jgi:hypothetical protein
MALYPPLPPPPPGGEPEVEVPEEPTEPRRSIRGLVVGLLAAILVTSTLAAVAWWKAPADEVCEASTVESLRFGYCIAAPGWRLTNEPDAARLPYDQLVRPADASTVRIVAIDLDAGQDLDLVVRTIRSIETEGAVEVEVGTVVERRVAGVRAAQWDVSVRGGSSDARRIREVVFVRDETAWRVQLLADAGGFDLSLDEFEAILRSWTFR